MVGVGDKCTKYRWAIMYSRFTEIKSEIENKIVNYPVSLIPIKGNR